MPRRPYSKPALTYEQQVAQLRRRGMTIADDAQAKFYLQHLNYYRLTAYWLPFESDHSTHQFRTGTTFEAVLNLYIFDRELRLLVMDAIERIEVSVRAQWAYFLGHAHGPHAHLDPSLVRKIDMWKDNIDSLEKEVNRSDEVFIKHLMSEYSEALPPIWASCEVMPLGLLSRWYANLRPMKTRQQIAGAYGADESVLGSWLHHLSIVRNICAHHSRLWNRDFTIWPQAPRSKPAALASEFMPNKKIYNSLIIMLYMLDVVSPRHTWRVRLKELLLHHTVPVTEMGFPPDWQTRSIWT